MLKQKLACLGAAVVFFASAPIANASYKDEVEIAAKSAYFIDKETQMVLFSKNPHEKIAPASLAKIVTALVVCKKVPDLNVTVEVPGRIFEEFAGQSVSSADIKRGEVVAVNDLIAAMMIPSACEASSALADYVSGGNIPAFVEQMNQEAKRLGANETHFVDAHGLGEDAYTTAYDTCIIVKEALKNPLLANLAELNTYEMPATNLSPQKTIYTTNKMLLSSNKDFYPKIKGFKTGSMETFKNFASYAVDGKTEVIGAVLGAPKREDKFGMPQNMAFADTKKVLNWVFNGWERRKLVGQGELLNEVDVVGCWKKDHVCVQADTDLYAMLPKGLQNSELKRKFFLPKVIKRSVKAGQKLGKVEFSLDDRLIAEVDLFAAEDVKINRLYGWIFGLKRYRKMLVVVVAGLLVLAYCLAGAKQPPKKRRARKRKRR